MFQLNVEMTSVTRNGSCVTMIAKISAGSSGARRRHRSRPVADGGPVMLVCSAGGASAVMAAVPPPDLLARVLRGDLRGRVLAGVERGVDVAAPGDRRAD